MNFKNRLKELLEEKQIKYNTLAKETEIPVTTLSNYINRDSLPSSTQLVKIANYFNVSVDYLIGRTDEDGIIKNNETQGLTKREQKLLQAFMQLDFDEQNKIIADCEYFANKHTKIQTQTQRRA